MTAPNNPLPGLPAGATSTVVSSIRQAAAASNVDFGLLMAQAQQESGFQPDAKASGSSATGLYQFIDQTWLGLVQRYGAQHGAGDLARQIATDANGRPVVSDAATRQRILDLRKDPRLSAALAADYTKQNKSELEQALGRPVGNAELYLAHFLGARGATSFLKAMRTAESTVAADLLPEAAAANRAIFYDASGAPRTLAQIYQSFANRINTEAQRYAGAAGPIGASLSLPSDISSYIRNLRFDGQQLTQPMAAMLDIFALSALKLVGETSAPTSSSASSRHRS